MIHEKSKKLNIKKVELQNLQYKEEVVLVFFFPWLCLEFKIHEVKRF